MLSSASRFVARRAVTSAVAATSATSSSSTRLAARAFGSTGVVRKAAGGSDAARGIVGSFLEADSPRKFVKLYHMTTYASLGLFPVALVLSPSALNMPVDLALGVVFPVHGHIGMNYIISDYVPKAMRGGARMALLAATGLTVLGLFKLNVSGPGVTETVKALWRGPKKEEESS